MPLTPDFPHRHWKYISSFHGPWLQLPPEILETLANANYNAPRPRPIDPAVFFDLVKIRRLVDDATNLAVRAASGVASSSLSGSGNASYQALGLGFGGGGPHTTKLSRERRHRMREQATQKLSRAYHLDEIASSVATMQSTSTLDDVASLVLQRTHDDPDARYVHFFHEKIPSRQLVESTSMSSLNGVIASRPTEGAPLRSRATVRVFKEDYDGAARDLTDALRTHRLYRQPHTSPTAHVQEIRGHVVSRPPDFGRHEDVILKEDEQPNSLEIQLLFHRAGVYLAMACQHVIAAFPSLESEAQSSNSVPVGSGEGHGSSSAGSEPKPSAAEGEGEGSAPEEQRLARKLARTNAKRALRDYMAFFSHFEYSPDLPIDIVEDFARKVNQTANGIRIPRSHTNAGRPDDGQATNGKRESNSSYHLYPLSELFAATPPSDLPSYPGAGESPTCDPRPPTTAESLTYHPLLTDALHSLLLCHCLVQTSTKELLRHAHMVARLARLADGYPVFQASRSPARADWIEVLRQGDNWIQLPETWEALCTPAPLPLFQLPATDAPPTPSPPPSQTTTTSSSPARSNAAANGNQPPATASLFPPPFLSVRPPPSAQPNPAGSAPRRWAIDDGREYPILTERASAVARWVLEAPPNAGSGEGGSGGGGGGSARGGSGGGGGKRKKKKGVARAASAAATPHLADADEAAGGVE